MLRQKPRKYDLAARTNMQIYGNKPAPPFAKPCWDDMLDMAKSLKSTGVKVVGKEYIDMTRGVVLASLPITNDMNRIKNNDLVLYGSGRLYKQTFENPNFPYWDAVWKYEDYWKNNWNKFNIKNVFCSRLEEYQLVEIILHFKKIWKWLITYQTQKLEEMLLF